MGKFMGYLFIYLMYDCLKNLFIIIIIYIKALEKVFFGSVTPSILILPVCLDFYDII